MMDLLKPPSERANDAQAAHIRGLLTIRALLDKKGDAFTIPALHFLAAFSRGTATQNQYADVYTMYADWQKERGDA